MTVNWMYLSENRQWCFTKFLELMKMSVQFQKPLVLLEWQARHQRDSRCARAGQVSGYYGVAMDSRGALDVPGHYRTHANWFQMHNLYSKIWRQHFVNNMLAESKFDSTSFFNGDSLIIIIIDHNSNGWLSVQCPVSTCVSPSFGWQLI